MRTWILTDSVVLCSPCCRHSPGREGGKSGGIGDQGAQQLAESLGQQDELAALQAPPREYADTTCRFI